MFDLAYELYNTGSTNFSTDSGVVAYADYDGGSFSIEKLQSLQQYHAAEMTSDGIVVIGSESLDYLAVSQTAFKDYKFTFYGGDGGDIAIGGEEGDVLVGSHGDDQLDGGFGEADDVVSGGTGEDVLIVRDGDNTAFGGQNDDWLISVDGTSYLIGNSAMT